MPLTFNFSKCSIEQYIVLSPEHEMYNDIKKTIESNQTWFKDDESGEIICLDPNIYYFIHLGGTLNLGCITASNIEEWMYRITFSNRVGYFNIQWCEWTETGWEYRPVTMKDLESLIGLRTNWGDKTRKAWQRRVVKYIESTI